MSATPEQPVVEETAAPETPAPDPTSREKQDTLTQSVGRTLAPSESKPWWKKLLGR